MGRFDDKVVWITGASSGLGREMAREFAREGAKVALSARRRDRLDALAEELGAVATVAPCDVTDEAQVEGAVAVALERFGRLDVAVANAGFGVAGKMADLPVADWRRQMDVNVIGAAATLRAALPELHKTGGRMALVGSVAGHVASPGTGPYTASKYAVRAMGQCLSMELAGGPVTCTTLCPGFVDSEIHQVGNDGRRHPERSERPNKLSWPTDRAARAMVRAIHARRREYVFTGHGIVGAFLGRHAPWLTHWAQTRGRGR